MIYLLSEFRTEYDQLVEFQTKLNETENLIKMSVLVEFKTKQNN